MAYSTPRIVLTSLGPTTPVTATQPQKVVMVLGDAPQGPDVPALIYPQQALSTYGDPSASASTGYKMPFALRLLTTQRQPGSNSGFRILGCRVGVTRATATVLDGTSGTCFTVNPVGAYAGTAGNGFQVIITVASGAVTKVQLVTSTGAILQTFTSTQYDLTSNAKIVGVINGANPATSPTSVAVATVGASSSVPVAATYTASGGLDGKGALSSNTTIATLLTTSLNYRVDYIVPLWDLGALASALSSHLTAASAVNSFRKVIGGPAQGTAFSTLQATDVNTPGCSYTNSFAGNRFWNVGWDTVYAVDPARGVQTAFDGFYLAAAYAGLKAVGPTEETCDGMPIAGFTNLAIPAGLTSMPADSAMQLIGAGGNIVLQAPFGTGQIQIRDSVTTAPFQTNGQLNPWYQANVVDIDDAVSYAAAQALLPFQGRPYDSITSAAGSMQAALYSRLAALGSTIGRYSATVSVTPGTVNPLVSLTYATKMGLLEIDITTSYTIG